MIILRKIFYKFFDKSKYQELKTFEKKKVILDQYNSNIYNAILKIRRKIEEKNELNFLHSGHLGDIIYSLPLIKELSKTHKCNLFIGVGKKMPIKYSNHPSGNVYLDKRIVELFIPLINNQKFINKVTIHNNEEIDVNLDLFREVPIDIKFHSTRWYIHLTGVQIDMGQPYLEVGEHNKLKNNIVIVRSPRYRNDFINYSFLNKTEGKIISIGLKSEYEDLKKSIKNLEFYNCKDFLELAQIIKSCRLFIGNECFAYSVAEGLKVPRLLEASPDFPVVFPVGKKAYDFYHQVHFEMFFEKLYVETKI